MVACTARSRQCGKKCVGYSRACYTAPNKEYNCAKATKAKLMQRLGVSSPPPGQKRALKKDFLVGLCRSKEEMKRLPQQPVSAGQAHTKRTQQPVNARQAKRTQTHKQGWDCTRPYGPDATPRQRLDSCIRRPGGKYNTLQNCVERCATWQR